MITLQEIADKLKTHIGDNDNIIFTDPQYLDFSSRASYYVLSEIKTIFTDVEGYKVFDYGLILIYEKFLLDSALYFKYVEGITKEQVDKKQVNTNILKTLEYLKNTYYSNWGRPESDQEIIETNLALFNCLKNNKELI